MTAVSSQLLRARAAASAHRITWVFGWGRKVTAACTCRWATTDPKGDAVRVKARVAAHLRGVGR